MYKALTMVAALFVLAVGIGQSPSNKRAYVAGKYALDLDGEITLLDTTEGGNAVADVIAENLAPDPVARKHIGNVKYEEISFKCGTGFTESKDLYEWIKASFDRKHSRKNGAIIAADYDYKEHSRREFFEALITEVGFPALDAASKDAAKMTLKFAPQSTRLSLGSGKPVAASGKKHKQWLPSNFRLKIDGLEEPCSRVNKIEAITIKQKAVSSPEGGGVSVDLEIPNLVITFPESHSKGFYDWHDDFVIKGNNGQDREKGGSLEYLTSDLKTVLFTLTFQQLGIFKVSPDKAEAGSENIRRVKAEMYCEEMSLGRFSPAP